MYMRIFISWLSVFPFVILYGAYEGPKVFWLWIGGFFLSVWWMIQMIRSRLPKIDTGEKWFFLWILALSIASIVGIHPIDSILGGSYRHQGVLFFFTLFLVWLTLGAMIFKQKRMLVGLVAFGVVVESLIILWQKISDWSARPLGTLGEPNAVAGFLAIGLFWIASSDFPKRVRLLLYILTLFAIVATGSRVGITTALIVTLGLAGKRVMAVLGIIGIGLIIFITQARPQSIYENRPLFWQLGIREVIARPILGYGAESGEVIYDRAFKQINVRLIDFMVDRSHNLFLDVALWSGVVGLILFTGWCIASGKELWKRDRRRFVVFIAWLVFASFQPLGVVHWLQLMFLLSWIYEQKRTIAS